MFRSRLAGGHRHRRTTGALLVAAACLSLAADPVTAAPSSVPPQTAAAPILPVPTVHPPVPATWADTWLVPEIGTVALPAWQPLVEGVRQYEAGNFVQALSALSDARLAGTPVAGYASYYAGLALQRLQRHDEARTRLESARSRAGESALAELSTVALAELAESTADPARAAKLYEEAIATLRPATPDRLLAGVVRSALAAGDRARAEAAALRLFYEFPTSAYTDSATALVDGVKRAADPARLAELAKRDLGRGERLFGAKQYADARATFVGLAPAASGDTRELIAIRIAECDYYLGRHRAAAEQLSAWVDGTARAAEARFFHALALRGLGNATEFVARATALADKYPDTTWAEDALNHLATYYILADQDDRAMQVFERLVMEHPTSKYAERAAWKLGWTHYRAGRFAEAADVFDRGTVGSPRSDYRPSWLYWSGRARERTGDTATAIARYQVAVADYQNSYYGRLARRALAALGQAPAAAAAPAVTDTKPAAPRPAWTPPPNAALVRALLALQLHPQARDEVQYAQRAWGTTPQLEATLAWVLSRDGELRRGITAMRRAYPQFLTPAGDQLPVQVLQVIFPVDHWPLIKRYAEARDLDPYLVAALIAQESTFQSDARSSANAWGLMQIVPSTGRTLARAEGLRSFRVSRLTDPETNVRLGTRYFAGLLGDFGEAHYALACYNAGESRVQKWRREKPGLPDEEFIDDIPFPETQNYVKRILGTAEDYRHLYGERGATPLAVAQRRTAPPAAAPGRTASASAASAKSKTVATRNTKPTKKKSATAKAPATKKGKPSSGTKQSRRS